MSEPAGDAVAVIPVIPVPSPLKYDADIQPLADIFPVLALMKVVDKLPIIKSPLALMSPATVRAFDGVDVFIPTLSFAARYIC